MDNVGKSDNNNLFYISDLLSKPWNVIIIFLTLLYLFILISNLH